jgi:N-acetylmuramoyl-L-alanine amidase
MDHRRVILSLLIFSSLITLLSFNPWEGKAAARWVVVIDAGHGGRDPGAIGRSGIPEKQITLEIARLIEIFSWADPQIEVVLTRRHDLTLSLRERIELANKLGAAVYVSIHANAHMNPGVEGLETLIHSSNHTQDLKLAHGIQRQLISRLSLVGVRDRGVKQQPLYLRWAKMPAVIVETGFITHPLGEVRLRSLWYQAQIAQAILEGIKAFLRGN